MQIPAALHFVQSHITAAEDVAKVKCDGEGQQGLPLYIKYTWEIPTLWGETQWAHFRASL